MIKIILIRIKLKMKMMILRNHLLQFRRYIDVVNKIWKIIPRINISKMMIKPICIVKFIGIIKIIKTAKYY
jgi:hypothetical protein